MDVFECITSRRSVRKYTDKPVKEEDIQKLIKAGVLAPSGLNGQPWLFYIVHKDKYKLFEVAQKSIFRRWVKTADCLIIVFLDKNKSYNYVKDVQSVGSVIQNILLTAHSMNLGCCWIGEILDKEKEIKEILSIHDNNVELMAVITVGNMKDDDFPCIRNKFESFIINKV